MLGSHSRTLTIPEAQFVIEVFKKTQADEQPNLDGLLRQILKHWRFRLWGIPIDPNIVLTDAGGSYSELIEQLVYCYGRYHQKHNTETSFWIDHTPTNIRYVPTLLSLFPEAKFIHLVRDGRAVGASIMPLDWGPNTIIHAANWWVEKIAHGLAAELRYGPEMVLRLRYEDIISCPGLILEKICAFLDLGYEPTLQTGSGFSPPLYTRSQHQLVGNQLEIKRSTAWEQKLTLRQIEIFEGMVGDLLELLGYEPKFGAKATAYTTIELLSASIKETYRRQLINRVRRSRRIRSHVK